MNRRGRGIVGIDILSIVIESGGELRRENRGEAE